jgi:hypothetical protein
MAFDQYKITKLASPVTASFFTNMAVSAIAAIGAAHGLALL